MQKYFPYKINKISNRISNKLKIAAVNTKKLNKNNVTRESP
jgi:hypothetical protein